MNITTNIQILKSQTHKYASYNGNTQTAAEVITRMTYNNIAIFMDKLSQDLKLRARGKNRKEALVLSEIIHEAYTNILDADRIIDSKIDTDEMLYNDKILSQPPRRLAINDNTIDTIETYLLSKGTKEIINFSNEVSNIFFSHAQKYALTDKDAATKLYEAADILRHRINIKYN